MLPGMPLLHALLLGVLEGLTEFLPVSSTGHLILFSDALGHTDDKSKAFDVIIQAGAVVAAALYFRARIADGFRGLLGKSEAGKRLTMNLIVAFVPAALVGLALHGWIKTHLFGPLPVAAALIVGGIVMVWFDRRFAKGARTLQELSTTDAAVIGCAQALSLWPGASRAMVTIVAGQALGLHRKEAAEFSFLLAIPTLGAATVFDLLKNRALFVDASSLAPLLVAGLAAFVTAWVVIAIFLRYLERFGLAPFGVYRVLLGIVVVIASGGH